MYNTSDLYKEAMNKNVRQPSLMELTFHFPSGDVVFTNVDIVKVTEKKTAHLIAGDLPTIDLSMTLKNISKLFNPNDTTNSPNYHNMIVEGVRINYRYGYAGIPKIAPLGYDSEVVEDTEPVIGMTDNSIFDKTYHTDDGFETISAEAFGFFNGYDTEWVDGGEVYTDGDFTYDATTATITAYDVLSTLNAKISYTFSGSKTMTEIANAVINLTDYSEDSSGNKKIILGVELDAFSTTISMDIDTYSSKEWLQNIAYAVGVKMYIDRQGYIHLDNEISTYSASQYHLTLANQKENPKHSKKQTPSKLTVELATKYGEPIETKLSGGGEEMVISGNPYIVTTASGEALSSILLDNFIPYRNEATIVYRGEPALDVLDNITFDADFADNLIGVITSSEITFNGTLSGSLVVRYQLGSNIPISVKVTGANNFVFPYLATLPTVLSQTLTCVTNAITPTFQWYYFTGGVWVIISTETSNTLNISHSAYYFNNEDSVKFKCVVNNSYGSSTVITKEYLKKESTAEYHGVIVGTSVTDIETEIAEPIVGDTVLLNNILDSGASTYGETYIYTGSTWVSTNASESLALSYKDALALAVSSEEDIHTANAYVDNLVANNAFLRNLITTNLNVGATGDDFQFNVKSYDENGVKLITPIFNVSYQGNSIFSINASTGNINFGDDGNGNPLFYYEQSTKTIRSKDDKFVIKSDGSVDASSGIFTGKVNADSGLFKGSIDAPSYSSLPTNIGTIAEFPFTGSATDQCLQMYSAYDQIPFSNTMYKATMSTNSNVAYIDFDIDSYDFGTVYLKNSSFVSIGNMHWSSGTFGMNYDSDFENLTFVLYISYGKGDVFKFKSLPVIDTGLELGQVWVDDGTLKIKS